MGTFVATMVRQSRNVGSTPWFPLGQYDIRGRCFPISYQGVVFTAIRLFARTVYARTLPPPTADSHVAAYSWV